MPDISTPSPMPTPTPTPIDWHSPPPAAAPALCQPGSATEALSASRHLGPRAAFIAGGTALPLAWGVAEEARPEVSHLIDLLAGALSADIAPAVLPDGTPVLRLGAGVTLETLRRDARVRSVAPRLAEAIEALAAPGVRHLATLGGNIGWRWGDALPALLAAGAWVRTADGAQAPLERILDEARAAGRDVPLVTDVAWPLPNAPRTGWSIAEKLGWRAAFSPSRLTLALEVGWDAGVFSAPRVAATAAGWPARRLAHVERWLDGRSPAALADRGSELRQACLADGADALRARLLARLLVGHLSHEARVHG